MPWLRHLEIKKKRIQKYFCLPIFASRFLQLIFFCDFLQINLVSKPGQTVIDFCSGSGDFTMAGLALGRNMVAMEGNYAQFTCLKDRVKAFNVSVAAPMCEPVDLPPALMTMNSDHKFKVDTAEMRPSEAKYFLHPCLLIVEPMGFGVADWETLNMSPPGQIKSVVREVEAAFKATAKYRVCTSMQPYLLH